MGTVSRVHTFAAGDILTAAELNAEYDNLLTSSAINGGLDATNLGVTAGQVTASKALVVDASRNLAHATGANRINNLALSGTFESTGLVTATAGITSGANIVSDTDSTDNLGTTSVRWANLYVDSIGDTGQALAITAGANNVNVTAGTVAVTGAQTVSSTLGVTGLLTATAGVTSGSTIKSDTDSTDDLGTTSVRWANLYVDSIGDTGQALAVTAGANNVNVTAGTVAITGAQTISSTLGITGLTTATGGITSGGNIISDTDSTDDLGTTSVRWANVYADSLGDTGQDLGIAATTVNLPSGFIFDYDAADVTITHSANTLTIAGGTLVGTINPDASSVLANGVTATTQSASDNSTKVATTAYADAAAAASAGTPGGSNTHVQFNNSGAFGGSANLTFDGTNLTATLSATSVLASGVTATTQSASDNSTKVATTAYVETAVASGGAGAAFNEFLLIGA